MKLARLYDYYSYGNEDYEGGQLEINVEDIEQYVDLSEGCNCCRNDEKEISQEFFDGFKKWLEKNEEKYSLDTVVCAGTNTVPIKKQLRKTIARAVFYQNPSLAIFFM